MSCAWERETENIFLLNRGRTNELPSFESLRQGSLVLRELSIKELDRGVVSGSNVNCVLTMLPSMRGEEWHQAPSPYQGQDMALAG